MTAANPRGCVTGELLEGVCRVTLQASKTEDRDLELHNRAAQRKRVCGTFRSKLFRQASSRRFLKQQAKRNVSDPFRIAAIRNTLRIAN